RGGAIVAKIPNAAGAGVCGSSAVGRSPKTCRACDRAWQRSRQRRATAAGRNSAETKSAARGGKDAADPGRSVTACSAIETSGGRSGAVAHTRYRDGLDRFAYGQQRGARGEFAGGTEWDG